MKKIAIIYCYFKRTTLYLLIYFIYLSTRNKLMSILNFLFILFFRYSIATFLTRILNSMEISKKKLLHREKYSPITWWPNLKVILLQTTKRYKTEICWNWESWSGIFWFIWFVWGDIQQQHQHFTFYKFSIKW